MTIITTNYMKENQDPIIRKTWRNNHILHTPISVSSLKCNSSPSNTDMNIIVGLAVPPRITQTNKSKTHTEGGFPYVK